MADLNGGRRTDDETRDRLDEIQNGYQKWARRVLILFGLQLVVLFSQGIVFTSQVDDVEKEAARRRAIVVDNQNKLRIEAGLGQCRRVNVSRRQLNVTEAALYLTLSQVAASPTLKLTAQGRKIARRYDTFARSVSYTPDTNCPAAVLDPLGYQAPDPIPYYKLPQSFTLKLTKQPDNPPPLPELRGYSG